MIHFYITVYSIQFFKLYYLIYKKNLLKHSDIWIKVTEE